MRNRLFCSFMLVFAILSLGFGQEYQPKFKGDPAKSDSEAAALGFMRTVISAEKIYKGRHNAYTKTLQDLAGTGSVTRRTVANNQRGDYKVSYSGNNDKYKLSLTPATIDTTHRSFFVDETGKIKAEEDKPATAESPAA